MQKYDKYRTSPNFGRKLTRVRLKLSYSPWSSKLPLRVGCSKYLLCRGHPFLWLDPKKGGKKSQDLELRSLQNRGLTRKKVKLGSASNSTFFLRDSHDFAGGYSTMVFPPAAVSGMRERAESATPTSPGQRPVVPVEQEESMGNTILCHLGYKFEVIRF